MSKQLFYANEEDADVRIDVFLTRSLTDAPSRNWVQKIIEAGQVSVNGKVAKANHKLITGDEVAVDLVGNELGQDLPPENIPLDIIYEDDYLIVINKPVGLLVHPAQGITTGTLVNALLYHCRPETGKALSDVNTEIRPGIVHRLDRETSGIIVAVKDNRAHVRLARQFEKHRVHKKYLALVEGEINFDEGVVDAPLARHPFRHDKKAVAFDDAAKAAKTFYRVLRRFGKEATLVALFPQSGRTHQLRVHMAYLGHPILGDDKYGKKSTFPRLALHAQSIAFKHPITDEGLEFSTPPPKEFLSPDLSQL